MRRFPHQEITDNIPLRDGQIHLSAIGVKPRWVAVASTDEASRILANFRNTYNLGASQMRLGCGNIRETLGNGMRGRLLYAVSFNGRVWARTGRRMT